MKALNYLQMWHLTTFDAIKYNEWLFTLYNEHSNLSDWAYFLAQPFKPEMITEYFEGWQIEDGVYWHKGFTSLEFEDEYMRYDYMSWMKLPRNLDEFITDCQRAGFELDLKEQK